MKIIKTSSYDKKVNIKDYPLFLYKYTIIDLSGSEYVDTYLDFVNNTINRKQWLTDVLTPRIDYLPGISELDSIRTLIDEDTCKISFKLPSDLIHRHVHLILLYAIDLLLYNDAEVSSGPYAVNPRAYSLNYNNVSIILCNSSDELINETTNIIDLRHMPKAKVSTWYDADHYSIHDYHYMSRLLDRHTYADIRYSDEVSESSDKKFIESHSGLEIARQRIGSSNPLELDGSLTIKSNRIIEL